jgi:hypothetical protein
VTHPAPNEPSEVQATHAWEVEQRILATARILREAWVDLARDLYEFFTQSLWRDLGHFSFDEWAETPSVGFGRRWAYEHIRIYRELVVLRDVEPDRLRTLEPSTCAARPAAPTSPRPRLREDRSRCLTKATRGR